MARSRSPSSKPSLHELADILEQIFQAAHGVTSASKCTNKGTFSGIHERAQEIALMRLYAKRWRP